MNDAANLLFVVAFISFAFVGAGMLAHVIEKVIDG